MSKVTFLSAFTQQPTPSAGYVAFVNLSADDTDVIFSVRSAGDNVRAAECSAPRADAIAMLKAALAILEG